MLILDCPRDTAISPLNVCQAGETLTCTSRSWPASSYVWIDNLRDGAVVQSGPTYILPAGPYNLTCVAYMYANCTNGYYSPVPFPDGVTTEGFPFNTLLNRTNTNTTIECSDNATVNGYAIGRWEMNLVRVKFIIRNFNLLSCLLCRMPVTVHVVFTLWAYITEVFEFASNLKLIGLTAHVDGRFSLK